MRAEKMKFAGVVVGAMTLFASSTAVADVTVTGTVGEIGIMAPQNNGQYNFGIIRFTFTDATQTKLCAQNANPNVGATYAWFWGASQTVIYSNPNANLSLPDPDYREWYSALLVSKKGSTLTCTLTDAVTCHVTSCTLP